MRRWKRPRARMNRLWSSRGSSSGCARIDFMKRLLLLLIFGATIPPALAVDSVVVFNEINYHPVIDEALNEWVELHNQMAIDMDISEWSLEGAVDFTFV